MNSNSHSGMESKLPFEKIKREILTKKEVETSSEYGKNPEERTVEELIQYSIVNIDKFKGPTSHQVSDYVQKILNINKSGHGGTLDPNVSGVLPVALGRATRIVQFLLTAGKEYIGIMHLHKEVKPKEIEMAFKEFIGKIQQKVPLRSAVKKQVREREIYYSEIIEIDGKDVLFRIGTQAGTYIRMWCHDLGKYLKVGAHMSELRRTKAGPFDESSLVTLQDLQDYYVYYKEDNDEERLRKVLQPVETGVSHLAKVWIIDSAVDPVCHGTSIAIPGISKFNSEIKEDELVAVMTLKNELVAIGIAKMWSEQTGKEQKGIAVKTKAVFMQPGVYPRYRKIL